MNTFTIASTYDLNAYLAQCEDHVDLHPVDGAVLDGLVRDGRLEVRTFRRVVRLEGLPSNPDRPAVIDTIERTTALTTPPVPLTEGRKA